MRPAGALEIQGDGEADPGDDAGFDAFATYRVAPRTTAGLRWMHANETGNGSDDHVDQVSIGLFHSRTQALSVHAIYTKTMNGSNAMYRAADYPQGDRVPFQPTVVRGSSKYKRMTIKTVLDLGGQAPQALRAQWRCRGSSEDQ